MSSSNVETERTSVNYDWFRNRLAIDNIRRSKKVLWATFFISIFFIVCGSMLVYESQFDSSSGSQNVGIIVVGSITLFLTFVLLAFLTYAARQTGYAFSWWFLILLMLGVMFGTVLGVISLINGVDVPNGGSRSTIGWVFGGIATGIAVISTFVCMIYLWKVYWDPLKKQVKRVEERETAANTNELEGSFDLTQF